MLTASKDQIIKVGQLDAAPDIIESLLIVDDFISSSICLLSAFQLYDIRAMKELESFRGHQKDVTG